MTFSKGCVNPKVTHEFYSHLPCYVPSTGKSVYTGTGYVKGWHFLKTSYKVTLGGINPLKRQKLILMRGGGAQGNMEISNQTCMNDDGKEIAFTSLGIYQEPDICHLLNRL